MSFLLNHTKLGFCWLDLIVLLVIIAIAVVTIVNIRKQKDEEDELKDKLLELSSDDVVISETEDKE